MTKYINWPNIENTPSYWISGDKNSSVPIVQSKHKTYEVPSDISCLIVPEPLHMKYTYRVVYIYNGWKYVLDVPVDMGTEQTDSIIKILVDMAVAKSNPEHEESFGYYFKQEIAQQFSLIKKSPDQEISMAAARLPGMGVRLKSPCDCYWFLTAERPLMESIIHLNDFHHWSREKIADWIDELHEAGTINAEFQPWDEGEGEKE